MQVELNTYTVLKVIYNNFTCSMQNNKQFQAIVVSLSSSPATSKEFNVYQIKRSNQV